MNYLLNIVTIIAPQVSAGATPATSAYLTAPPVYVTSSAVPSGGLPPEAHPRIATDLRRRGRRRSL